VKKILLLTLVVVMMMASSAMAMLKVLEPALASELEGLVREQIAAERKVNIDQVTINEGWLLELHNIKAELYVVTAIVGGDKVERHVHVGEKRVLTAEEVTALKAANEKAAPTEPVMRIMSAIDTTAEKAVQAQAITTAWAPAAAGVGTVMLLGVGAYLFIRRR